MSLLKWFVMYLLAYAALLFCRHISGFEITVLSGLAWVIANQESK